MSETKRNEKRYGRLTVKNLKSCVGKEGYAYSATLYLDGKKVGQVRNDGNGGMTFVDFFRKVRGKVVRDHEAEKKVLAYVAEQPAVDMGPDPKASDYPNPEKRWMMEPSLDWVVSQVCEDALAEREQRRWCRTKVCFRVEGDPDGEWRVFKGKFRGDEQRWRGIVESHCARNGLRLEEILNERFAA